MMQIGVVESHKHFIRYENGFALHDRNAMLETIFGEHWEQKGPRGMPSFSLYFETSDLKDQFMKVEPLVELIHPIERQAWGQKVFRFYDPDGHIVEVGEPQ